MILHIKCTLYVVILYKFVTQCGGSDLSTSDSEGEDVNLKQALILVDLLRAGFANALRKNNKFRSQDVGIAEASSSAATTGEPKPTASTAIRFRRQYDPTGIASSTDAASNGQPVTEDETTYAVDATTDSATEMKNDISQDVEEETAVVPTISQVEEAAKEELVTTKEKPSLDTYENLKVQDPVISQVASELFNEMKDQETRNPKSTSTRVALRQVTKQVTKERFIYNIRNIKPTLKIYLEGSTRFPIPLPENHAFCYTNPKSALCRTFIK